MTYSSSRVPCSLHKPRRFYIGRVRISGHRLYRNLPPRDGDFISVNKEYKAQTPEGCARSVKALFKEELWEIIDDGHLLEVPLSDASEVDLLQAFKKHAEMKQQLSNLTA